MSIGQIFYTGIQGFSLTEEESEFLEKEDIGGVILFSHNFDCPAQLAELVNSIQKCRDEYPLLICTDHEGGRAQQFTDGFTHFPAMGDIATLESPKVTFEVHQIMAEELKACGVNTNLAPCCDILSNNHNKIIGDRSFGSDCESVSKHISAAIRGLQTAGIIACAKHFPGHGDTSKNSSQGLAVVKNSCEKLEQREVVPFSRASRARVELMMMGHLQVDSIDEEIPCSLSEKAHSYLRDKTKFRGLIISDNLEAKAITDKYSASEVPLMAIKAGCDLLLYKSFEGAKKAYNAVKASHAEGKLKNSGIADSLKKIEDLKKRYLSSYEPIYIPSIQKVLGRSTSIELSRSLAQKILSEAE